MKKRYKVGIAIGAAAVLVCSALVGLYQFRTVDFELIDSTSNADAASHVALVHSEDADYKKYGLDKYDADFNEETLMVAQGFEVQSLEREGGIFSGKTHFVRANVTRCHPDEVYIYKITGKDIYFDEHFRDSHYINVVSN